MNWIIYKQQCYDCPGDDHIHSDGDTSIALKLHTGHLTKSCLWNKYLRHEFPLHNPRRGLTRSANLQELPLGKIFPATAPTRHTTHKQRRTANKKSLVVTRVLQTLFPSQLTLHSLRAVVYPSTANRPDTVS